MPQFIGTDTEKISVEPFKHIKPFDIVTKLHTVSSSDKILFINSEKLFDEFTNKYGYNV